MYHVLMCVTWLLALSLPASAVSRSEPPSAQSPSASLQAARDARERQEAGYGERFRFAASRLARSGEAVAAMAALDELLERPETPLDRPDALRMKALYVLSLPGAAARLQESTVYLQQALAAFDDRPELARSSLVYASVVVQLAERYLSFGMLGDALITNRRLFDLPEGGVRQRVLADSFERQSRILAASSDFEGAADALESLFIVAPNYGLESGRSVVLRLRLVLLRTHGQSENAVLAEVEGLWRDPSLSESPSIMDVGREVLRRKQTQGDLVEVATFAKEMIDRLDQNRHRWTRGVAGEVIGAQPEARWRQVEITLLSIVSSNSTGTTDEYVLWALDRLATIPDPSIDPASLQVARGEALARRNRASAPPVQIPARP